MNTFSCGFCWFYWDYYKDKEAVKSFYKLVDEHLDHKPKDLYVKQKFQSYKQEILSHLSKRQYLICYTKAKKYFPSAKVKALKAAENDLIYHFGIAGGTPISLDHIMSIILYCDMDRYSSRFSETFRKLTPHDTLNEVKARNAAFWWQSKLFKETIIYYGLIGDNLGKNEANAFYTGVTCLLPIPQFNIHLYAPTSTSVQLSVATKFASDDGMIISFTNQRGPATLLAFFDCSWISRYPDEDERVFAHGFFPIEIQCVRIMETNSKYISLFAALYVFDITFSSFGIFDENMLEQPNMDVIDELFENECIFPTKERLDVCCNHTESDVQQTNPTNDPYIKSMFNQYIQQKKKVVISLQVISHVLLEYQQRSAIYSSLFESGILKAKIVGSYNIHCRLNLLSPNVFKFFPNVKEITIYTHGDIDSEGDEHCYPFNLLFFLENIST